MVQYFLNGGAGGPIDMTTEENETWDLCTELAENETSDLCTELAELSELKYRSCSKFTLCYQFLKWMFIIFCNSLDFYNRE